MSYRTTGNLVPGDRIRVAHGVRLPAEKSSRSKSSLPPGSLATLESIDLERGVFELRFDRFPHRTISLRQVRYTKEAK